MTRLALPALALFALSGCSKPTDVAVQFHEALAKGDGVKAFSLLSKPTQEKLAERAKQAHQLSGGTLPDDPALMIVQGDGSLYPAPAGPTQKVASATMISAEGSRAKVSVHLGQAAHEMDLVKEGGRWRIDLPVGKP